MYLSKFLLILVWLIPFPLIAEDYTQKAEVQQFIEDMNKKYNYKTAYLNMLFKQVRKDPRVPKKKSKTKRKKTFSAKYRPQGKWDIYSRMHLENNQTQLGIKFMHKYKNTLEKAHKLYGVPPEYITAIIGIESYYGKNRGTYYVFDSLTHLAFDGDKRSKFYKYQLQEFLRMCYREQVEPRAIKGSRSGAIGMAQFMPDNYKLFAVDFDKNGKIRLSKPYDAIGSIANYLKKNGWERDKPVGIRVKYRGKRFNDFETGLKHKYHRKELTNITPRGYFAYRDKVMLIKLEKEKYDELWYGAKNFYVISRYNHSDYYAMAVHQLAQKIKKAYYAKYKKLHSPKKKRAKVYLAKKRPTVKKVKKRMHSSKTTTKATTFPETQQIYKLTREVQDLLQGGVAQTLMESHYTSILQ